MSTKYNVEYRFLDDNDTWGNWRAAATDTNALYYRRPDGTGHYRLLTYEEALQARRWLQDHHVYIKPDHSDIEFRVIEVDNPVHP